MEVVDDQAVIEPSTKVNSKASANVWLTLSLSRLPLGVDCMANAGHIVQHTGISKYS